MRQFCFFAWNNRFVSSSRFPRLPRAILQTQREGYCLQAGPREGEKNNCEPQKIFIPYIRAVAAEHPLAGGAVRVREPGDHPRVLPVPGQERQDHARPRQGEQGPAEDGRRGQSGGQPLPPHQVEFNNYDIDVKQ